MQDVAGGSDRAKLLKWFVGESLRTKSLLGYLLLLAAALLMAPTCRAVELKFSAQALERTVRAQLFHGDAGRYYLRGDAGSACYVYAEAPSVSFVADRIVVHIHTSARLGTRVHGTCLGVGLAPNVDVSLIPVAEGETIGFRDARIENLSTSRELNFVLMPFLSRQVPSSLKINAATLIRQALSKSRESTGYTMDLEHLKIHSMQVENNLLVIDVDGDLRVN